MADERTHERLAALADRVKGHDFAFGLCLNYYAAAWKAEVEEALEARDAAQAAVCEFAFQNEFGETPVAEALAKYTEIYGRLAAMLGVKLPWEVEPGVERLQAQLADARNAIKLAVGRSRSGPWQTVSEADVDLYMEFVRPKISQTGKEGGP